MKKKEEKIEAGESKKTEKTNLVDLDKVSHAENYLRENVRNHSIADLKNALLAGNYSEAEINEAIRRMQGGTFVDSPFEIGRLFKNTWDFFRANLKKLFLISFIANLPLVAFLLLNSENFTKLQDPKLSETELFQMLKSFIFSPVEVGFIVLSVFAMIIGFVAIYKAILDIDNGETKSIGGHFSASLKFIIPIIFIEILQFVLIIFGLFLLLVPALIFAVWWTFAEFTLLNENKRGYSALKASRELVRGRWWGVFGRIVLVAILIGTISAILGLVQFIPVIGNASSQVVSIFGTVFLVIFQYMMYKALREMKG